MFGLFKRKKKAATQGINLQKMPLQHRLDNARKRTYEVTMVIHHDGQPLRKFPLQVKAFTRKQALEIAAKNLTLKAMDVKQLKHAHQRSAV